MLLLLLPWKDLAVYIPTIHIMIKSRFGENIPDIVDISRNSEKALPDVRMICPFLLLRNLEGICELLRKKENVFFVKCDLRLTR